MLPNVARVCHAHFFSDLAVFDDQNRGLTSTATSGDRISDTMRPIEAGFEVWGQRVADCILVMAAIGGHIFVYFVGVAEVFREYLCP
jgi:hypothetical protein